MTIPTDIGASFRVRAPEVYERGRLRMDFDTYEVFLDGQTLPLSLRELELLDLWVSSAHQTPTLQVAPAQLPAHSLACEPPKQPTPTTGLPS